MVFESPKLEGKEWMLLVCGDIVHLSPRCNPSICSCFNAFSRVDMRVDVKIPGGVNAYVIDLRGERCVRLSSENFTQAQTLLDMMRHPKSGKKHTSRRYYARFCTRMTRLIGWRRTAN